MKKLVIILLVVLLVVGIAFAAGGEKKPVSITKSDKNAYVDGKCVSETKDGKKADRDVYGTKVSDDGKKATFYTWSTSLGDSRNGPKVFVKDTTTGELKCRGNGLTPGLSNDGKWLAFESVPKDVYNDRPFITLQNLETGEQKFIAYTSRLGYWMPNVITWADDDSYFDFYSYSEKWTTSGDQPVRVRYYVSGLLRGVVKTV